MTWLLLDGFGAALVSAAIGVRHHGPSSPSGDRCGFGPVSGVPTLVRCGRG
ncbi:MAG: hypothetical protein ACR2KK_10545 [Acidimicrobiales bacterium]